MTERSQRPPWLGEDARGWDHVRIHVQLLQDERITHHEIAVYAGIAVHAELATGQAYPSKATLADYTGMSARRVQQALHILTDCGYIRAQHRHGAASVLTLLPPPKRETTQAPAARVEDSDPSTSCPPPSTSCSGTQAPPAPEQEPVTRTTNENNPSTSASKLADAPRPEVEQLCTLLADLIEGNGSKRPRITKRWRDACRLMLDRDERTPQQVEAAIRWCQADEFWRANIMSMPKLREQYDRLRLAAQRQRASGPAHASDVAARYDAIADELDRRERTTR